MIPRKPVISRNTKDGKPFRMTELFSGIGAQRMGMIRGKIPHKVVATSEIDRYAARSYEAIYGDNPNLGDIRLVRDIPGTDILIYSFPCQSVSQAGRGEGMAKGSGTKSSLVWEVGRILEHEASQGTLPEWLLMENVPAVMSPKHRPELDLWLDYLESLGYSSRMGKLNAKDFGVPQNRERAYVLSRLGAAVPDLPTGYGAGAVLDDILETDVPDRYLLKAKLARTRPDGQRVPDRCVQVGTAEGINGHDSMKRVYSPKGLAPTVVTGSGGNVMRKVPAGKDGVRKLTPRECWRLQGFPDWAYDRARDIPTSDSQLYKQAGNSIPVPVLTEIFKVIDKADIEKKEGKKKKKLKQTTLKSENRRTGK